MQLTQFEVVIIGAGLGGICLAQNLRKNGISVAIFERHDKGNYLAEGFWIELNQDGIESLKECLTPHHFNVLMGTSQPANRSGDRWLPRAVLQNCLLQGLEQAVRFEANFLRYEERSDGRVAAVFADGTSLVADVLVAADGVHSRIRQQKLPHARRIDTGILAIGGTAAPSDEILRILPPRVFDFPVALQGPKNWQMYIALWRANAAAADRDSAGFRVADQVMWRIAGLASDFGLQPAAEQVAPDALKAAVLEMAALWSPPILRLVELIDTATVFPLPLRTCIPIAKWETSPVTLIGDAIHGMAPYGGFGANMAIRDAAVLGRKLVLAHSGGMPLLQAIHDYEVDMIGYGFDAVRRSMHILQQANQMPPSPLV